MAVGHRCDIDHYQAFQQIRQIEEVAARYANEPAARITVEAFE